MALRMPRCRASYPLGRCLLFVALWSLVLASNLTGVALAQSSHEVALARALFEEGVSFADQGDWSAAADRFGRAYALKPTAGIAFNWASALVETKNFTQAMELLEGVVRDPQAAPQLQREAQDKLDDIAPRRAKLAVHVDPEVPKGSSVLIDGKRWPEAVWDVAAPIDPGDHTATCVHEERELCRASFTLEEQEARDLDLKLAPAEPAAEPVASAATAATRDEKKPLYKNWIVWTSVGVGVVAVVLVASLAGRGADTKAEQPVSGNAQPGVLAW